MTYLIPSVENPIIFPEYYETDENGIVAVGGNLLPETLIDAYSKGLFPWFNREDPILWWFPEPRYVIFPKEIHMSRSMKKVLKKVFRNFTKDSSLEQLEDGFKYYTTINKDFEATIKNCAYKRSKNRTDTWILPEMISSYIDLHKLGYAHSIEVWNHEQKLIGGIYGVAMGKVFFGESMFSHEKNASKIAIIHLCQYLYENGFILLDCQVYSKHLESLGAVGLSKKEFLGNLMKGKTARKEICYEFVRTR